MWTGDTRAHRDVPLLPSLTSRRGAVLYGCDRGSVVLSPLGVPSVESSSEWMNCFGARLVNAWSARDMRGQHRPVFRSRRPDLRAGAPTVARLETAGLGNWLNGNVRANGRPDGYHLLDLLVTCQISSFLDFEKLAVKEALDIVEHSCHLIRSCIFPLRPAVDCKSAGGAQRKLP